jgi:hypothetical protein
MLAYFRERLSGCTLEIIGLWAYHRSEHSQHHLVQPVAIPGWTAIFDNSKQKLLKNHTCIERIVCRAETCRNPCPGGLLNVNCLRHQHAIARSIDHLGSAGTRSDHFPEMFREPRTVSPGRLSFAVLNTRPPVLPLLHHEIDSDKFRKGHYLRHFSDRPRHRMRQVPTTLTAMEFSWDRGKKSIPIHVS